MKKRMVEGCSRREVEEALSAMRKELFAVDFIAKTVFDVVVDPSYYNCRPVERKKAILNLRKDVKLNMALPRAMNLSMKIIMKNDACAETSDEWNRARGSELTTEPAAQGTG